MRRHLSISEALIRFESGKEVLEVRDHDLGSSDHIEVRHFKKDYTENDELRREIIKSAIGFLYYDEELPEMLG